MARVTGAQGQANRARWRKIRRLEEENPEALKPEHKLIAEPEGEETQAWIATTWEMLEALGGSNTESGIPYSEISRLLDDCEVADGDVRYIAGYLVRQAHIGTKLDEICGGCGIPHQEPFGTYEEYCECGTALCEKCKKCQECQHAESAEDE